MTNYLLSGGGSAGHVNPLLATADRILQRSSRDRITMVGTAEGLEARLVPARGHTLETIPRAPFPRRTGVDALRFPIRFHHAVGQVRRLLTEGAAKRCSEILATTEYWVRGSIGGIRGLLIPPAHFPPGVPGP
ncbi:glycosyltransferase [Acaricomes phytoseiuli]|uniref:glycosyltransferase n=1 Tax=Acaricomes phytoseiuli TaxID=291968 RepID=UPI000A04EF3E